MASLCRLCGCGKIETLRSEKAAAKASFEERIRILDVKLSAEATRWAGIMQKRVQETRREMETIMNERSGVVNNLDFQAHMHRGVRGYFFFTLY